MSGELRMWFWIVTDELTKRRRKSTYRMTEADAAERFGVDAEKIEDSLEIRRLGFGHTSDFLKKLDH